MNNPSDRPGGWRHHSRRPVTHPLDFVTQIPVPASDTPLMLHLLFTDDGLYVPAVVRTPPGNGPFPLIICLHGGSGGLGISYLVDQMLNRGYVFDALLAEGYAVCATEGRAEVEWANGTDLETLLDHHDTVTIFRAMQRQPFVDAARIGFFGVSHGGELQLKLISEIGRGPAALVAGEPAVVEFLSLQHDGPRTERTMQYNYELPDTLFDLTAVRARLDRIAAEVPILILGREEDHLQGLHRKLFELLQQAGKNVYWRSWNYPEHAYQYGPARSSAGYQPDEIQVETLQAVLGFMNGHVRDGGA